MPDDHASALARAFLAEQPAQGLDLSLFGQFAGSWLLDCTEYAPDGSSTVKRGEWHFGFALGGRATTDVWILPGVEHGVSVRFPDPAAGRGSGARPGWALDAVVCTPSWPVVQALRSSSTAGTCAERSRHRGRHVRVAERGTRRRSLAPAADLLRLAELNRRLER